MSAKRSRLDELLADLNEPQRRAVMHVEGPLLVLAGPGSGKTRVITRRAAYLVRSGARPHEVLAITFTNKAADEMLRRIERLGVARGMWVCTFHSLCARLLREYGELCGVQPGFSIYDEADQRRVVKQAIENCGIQDPQLTPAKVLAAISRAKNALLTPEAYHDLRQQEFGTVAELLTRRIYTEYDRLLRERNAVDFDDLLMRVALLLRDNAEVAAELGQRFRFVLIDEYQDTNFAQYLIANLLTQQHRNICATGDPDQSIYGWRGANLGNILEFERDYPDAVVVRLEQNYRSTGHILTAAADLIAHNFQRKAKDLWGALGQGEPVQVLTFDDGNAEAAWIARRVAELHSAGRAYDEIAIMYRVNALSRTLEEELRARNIPYKMVRGVEFYNRREIRDTLAYLRLVINPHDTEALLRIINTPARGIGKTTIERLMQAATAWRCPLYDVLGRLAEVRNLRGAALRRVAAFAELLADLRAAAAAAAGPQEALEIVLELSGLEAALRTEDESAGEDRWANVTELVTAAARFERETPEPTLEEFLQRVALVSDQDQLDQAAGAVLLMTLHAAKGLEFPVVFIIGLEQGTLPHERALGGQLEELEEERRLLFVGITRAMRELYLSHAQRRAFRGSVRSQTRSKFLFELPGQAIVERDLTRAGCHALRRGNPGGEVTFDAATGLPLHDTTGSAGETELPVDEPPDADPFADEPSVSLDDPTGTAPA